MKKGIFEIEMLDMPDWSQKTLEKLVQLSCKKRRRGSCQWKDSNRFFAGLAINYVTPFRRKKVTHIVQKVIIKSKIHNVISERPFLWKNCFLCQLKKASSLWFSSQTSVLTILLINNVDNCESPSCFTTFFGEMLKVSFKALFCWIDS